MNQTTEVNWIDEWSYVKDRLLNSGFDTFTGGAAKKSYPFRSRYEHTKRVMKWMKRIVHDRPGVDREALELAIIFHDVGYSMGENKEHCVHSEEIFREYVKHRVDRADIEGKNIRSIYYDEKRIEYVAKLIRNHSDKERIGNSDISDELLIMMEADLLDEEGAMRIAWDGMAEGMAGGESFQALMSRHRKFWKADYNPMVTACAKEFFAKKQKLVAEYLKQMEFDLEE